QHPRNGALIGVQRFRLKNLPRTGVIFRKDKRSSFPFLDFDFRDCGFVQLQDRGSICGSRSIFVRGFAMLRPIENDDESQKDDKINDKAAQSHNASRATPNKSVPSASTRPRFPPALRRKATETDWWLAPSPVANGSW